jgi:hypothetical protein
VSPTNSLGHLPSLGTLSPSIAIHCPVTMSAHAPMIALHLTPCRIYLHHRHLCSPGEAGQAQLSALLVAIDQRKPLPLALYQQRTGQLLTELTAAAQRVAAVFPVGFVGVRRGPQTWGRPVPGRTGILLFSLTFDGIFLSVDSLQSYNYLRCP